MSDTLLTPDASTRLVIDPVTRVIEPKYRRQKAVYVAKGDHNSVLIAFEMPRYVDGYDMSAEENSIQIHYDNISEEDDTKHSKGFSGAINVTVETDEETQEEIVSFCWLIPNTATKYAGTVSIGVTFERYDMVEGTLQEAYSWSTAPYEETIVWDSMDNTKEAVEGEYNYLVAACTTLVATILKEAIDSGKLDGVSATHSWDGTTLNITSASGTSSANLKGDTGKKGDTGDSGVYLGAIAPSDPDVNVWINTTGGGAVLYIKDDGGNWKECPTIAGSSAYEIAKENGYKGTEEEWLEALNGKDGFSPTVKVEAVGNGNRVTITDAEGAHSFFVSNGYVLAENVPVTKGSGMNAVIAGNLNNTALSDYSTAAGGGTTAGHKAYYIKSIDSAKGKIYLSKTQVTPTFSTADNTNKSFATPAFEKGDEFSIIVGGSHYILCGKVDSIQNNVLSYTETYRLTGTEEITLLKYVEPVYYWKVAIPYTPSGNFVRLSQYYFYGVSSSVQVNEEPSLSGDGYIVLSSIFSSSEIMTAFSQNEVYAMFKTSLPFSEFPDIANPSTDDYTLCVPSKPLVGVVTLGDYAYATGLDNIAAGYASVASGYDNVAAGGFSAVFGRHNKVGYAGIVTGFENTAIGNGSAAFGYHNNVNGNQCYATGNTNITQGDNNHLKGNSNTAIGSHNHVDGRGNKVDGLLNKVSGDANKVTGSVHDVSGQYNTVSGNRNVVSGYYNTVSGDNQTVLGHFNADDPSKMVIVGGGNSTNRENIMTLDKAGNIYIKGKLQSPSSDDYLYTFDTYRSVDQTGIAFLNVTTSCYDRSLKLTSTTPDPQMHKRFDIPLDGEEYPVLKIRCRIDSNGKALSSPIAKIYFTTKDYTEISEARRAMASIAADGEWHDVIFDMSANSYWDAVTKIRFDIPNSSIVGVITYIKYIGLFHDIDEANSFFLTNGSGSSDDSATDPINIEHRRRYFEPSADYIAAGEPHTMDYNSCYAMTGDYRRGKVADSAVSGFYVVIGEEVSGFGAQNNAVDHYLEFPVRVEIGKTYTLNCTGASSYTVKLIKYNADTTFNSAVDLVTSVNSVVTRNTFTAESGYLYSVAFSTDRIASEYIGVSLDKI